MVATVIILFLVLLHLSVVEPVLMVVELDRAAVLEEVHLIRKVRLNLVVLVLLIKDMLVEISQQTTHQMTETQQAVEVVREVLGKTTLRDGAMMMVLTVV
jgi:hypothetical protein